MAYTRPDIAQDRNVVKWTVWLFGALIVTMIIGLVVLNALYGRPNYYVGMYDATGPVTSLGIRGETWVPQGEPVALPDERMVAIAATDEGYFVYTRRDLLGGGGGPRPREPELGALPRHYQDVYLRTREGTYQPVRRFEEQP